MTFITFLKDGTQIEVEVFYDQGIPVDFKILDLDKKEEIPYEELNQDEYMAIYNASEDERFDPANKEYATNKTKPKFNN